MSLRGSGLFRDGAILILFSKYAWYRRTGYPHPEAAMKARWRAGLLPAASPGDAAGAVGSAIPAADGPVHLR